MPGDHLIKWHIDKWRIPEITECMLVADPMGIIMSPLAISRIRCWLLAPRDNKDTWATRETIGFLCLSLKLWYFMEVQVQLEISITTRCHKCKVAHRELWVRQVWAFTSELLQTAIHLVKKFTRMDHYQVPIVLSEHWDQSKEDRLAIEGSTLPTWLEYRFRTHMPVRWRSMVQISTRNAGETLKGR